MKKHITAAIAIAILASLYTGCATGISDGQSSTIRTSQFDGAQGNCTNGGVKIEVLVDGELDDTQTQYICNGVQGGQGQAGGGQSGSSTTMRTTLFTDAQGSCTEGGVKIEVLVNGVVDEVQTQYICNGMQGQGETNTSIQTSTFEGNQGSCTNGGIKVETLVDGGVDEALTKYFCNDTNGSDSTNSTNTSIQTTHFNGAQGECTNGGIKIKVLVDGVVQEGQTQYICNGADGQDGQDGQDGSDGQNGTNGTNASIQTTTFEGTQGDCTNGGTKIEVLLDGVVQTDQTRYICNGVNGSNGITDTFLRICGGTVVNLANDVQNCGSCSVFCRGSHECVETKCVPRDFPDLGKIITFGLYEQDNDTTNGKEPIEWRVIDKNAAGQYLIISEKVLDMKSADHFAWERSSIRSWLNGYDGSYNAAKTDYTTNNFIDTAFSAEEKAKIVLSSILAHYSPDSENPGNATLDRIFLLSKVEAQNYFISDTDRLADATRYAIKKGVKVIADGSGTISPAGTCANVHCYAFWWLRSPSFYGTVSSSYYTACVTPKGSFSDEIIKHTMIGVRPALWVNY